jgi:glycerol-3-phosphate O-acyltransferase
MNNKGLSKIPHQGLRGYGMQEHHRGIVGWFGRRYLRSIPYPNEAATKLRELAQRGTVVYALRSRNVVDHLALSVAAQERALPIARFVGGLDVRFLHPWWKLYKRKSQLREAPAGEAEREEWLLKTCIENGDAAELFLRRPLTLMTGKSEHPARYIETLIRLQRESDKPIFIVPHFLSLRSVPSNFSPTTADAIFGTTAEPGLLRALVRMLSSQSVARWEVSDPVDLQAFLQEQDDQRNAVLAKKVRWAILHHLTRIERVSHGPPLKSPDRMCAEVFRDPTLKRQLEQIATKENQPIRDVNAKAQKCYREIAATPDFDWAHIFDKLLKVVWRIIFKSLEVDQDDLDRLRVAARRGPLILVPSHRSHVDYLVMSQAFLWNGLLPPLVAAGINLNFFPIGPLFRRMGAYFLRRNFKGDRIYSAVFRAYVRKLYKEGFTQEFFIEGGRSRTGKTLPPKTGILGMLFDAFIEGRQEDAIFFPACISYEKILEGSAYTRELEGGEKEKENAGALVKSAGILKSRYGRVYISFGPAISLKEELAKHGLNKEALQTAAHQQDKRNFVRELAYQIVYEINQAVVVTANATAVAILFGFRKRGLDSMLLHDTVDLVLTHIRAMSGPQVRFSQGLLEHSKNKIQKALDRLVAGGHVHLESAADRSFYSIDEKAYLELDYYKNNIIHFFAPVGILATALRSLKAQPGQKIPKDLVRERTKTLSEIFKKEFIFHPSKDHDAAFAETIELAHNYGTLEVTSDGICFMENIEAKRTGDFAANLFANFIDAYWCVGRNLRMAISKSVTRKALVLDLLDRLRADFLAGDVVCPEAQSKSTVDNAVQFYQDRGILVKNETQRGFQLHEPVGQRHLNDYLLILDAARLGDNKSS